MTIDRWVNDDNVALLTDQYQLTMLQGYWRERMEDHAVFSLFVRRLPASRNFLLACGLDTVLGFMEDLHFNDDALDHLAATGTFDEDFLRWLGDLRFTGDVWAMPEGTPFFPDEPILEVVAPIAEAQLLETFVMNQVHMQTVLASKAVRVKEAAGEARVVDFGLRRMHGADAGLKSARAFHVAGIDATSNVLAGRAWGVPVTGTMAHSYIEAHESEMEAFRAFVRAFPETVLLVDTYDTLEGVRKVVELAEEMGNDFRVRGVRLDSGDLGELARESRRILDNAGLQRVRIVASGGLDEFSIRELLQGGAPIDAFGVGTGMGVARDAPSLDIAYKLTGYAGKGRLKLSSGKRTLPGRKQVFRRENGEGRAIGDTIARADESLEGRPLLGKVMEGGRRLEAGRDTLEEARERTRRELAKLPRRLRELEEADPHWEVEVSSTLEEYTRTVIERVAKDTGNTGDRQHGGESMTERNGSEGEKGSREVLVLVDIQLDFLPGGSLAVVEGDEILEPVARLMKGGRFPLQVATQDWHPQDHVSFASRHQGKEPMDVTQVQGHDQILWPDHCVQGTGGAELHPDLPWEEVQAVIRKGTDPESDSYSGFRNNWDPRGERPPTGLAGYLRERGVERVWICGLARDVCVRWTAQNAAEEGFETHVIWDLTRSVDPSGDADLRKSLEDRGIRIVDSVDI